MRTLQITLHYPSFQYLSLMTTPSQMSTRISRMSNQYSSLAENQALANTFIDAMARVYMWMTGGLLITALVATGVASSDELMFT